MIGFRKKAFPFGDGAYQIGFDSWKKPIAIDAQRMREHVLITGDDDGHRQAIVENIQASAIANGDGLIVISGSNSRETHARIYAEAVRSGRRDDVLILDFTHAMTSENTNVCNPFMRANAEEIVAFCMSLLGEDTGTPMSRGRICIQLTVASRVLVWMREESLIDIGPTMLADAMTLERLCDFAWSHDYRDMPLHVRRSVRSYLNSLPNFVEGTGKKQPSSAIEWHVRYQTEILHAMRFMLEGRLRNMFDFNSQVDMADVLTNGRILVVLLPCTDDDAKVAKAIGLMLKSPMSTMTTMPAKDGSPTNWKQVVDHRVIQRASPSLVVLDDVSIPTIGTLELHSAQMRALGCATVISIRDSEIVGEKDAVRIEANSNTRIFARDSFAMTYKETGVIGIAPERPDPAPGLVVGIRSLSHLGNRPKESDRFHTAEERSNALIEAMRTKGVTAAIRAEPFTFAAGLPHLVGDGTRKTTMQRTFGLVGSYAKYKALAEATKPEDKLFRLGA